MGKIKVKDTGWAKQTQYVDEERRRITEFELLDGIKRGKKIYMGFIEFSVQVRMNMNTPPQIKRVPLDFEFPEGKSFDWCRKNFDDSSNAAIQQWKKDQDKAQKKIDDERKEKKIITPGNKKGKILDPKGRELK